MIHSSCAASEGLEGRNIIIFISADYWRIGKNLIVVSTNDDGFKQIWAARKSSPLPCLTASFCSARISLPSSVDHWSPFHRLLQGTFQLISGPCLLKTDTTFLHIKCPDKRDSRHCVTWCYFALFASGPPSKVLIVVRCPLETGNLSGIFVISH